MTCVAERPVLNFRVGETQFGVAAEVVAEVLRMPATTRMPYAPQSLVGIANLRGVVTPIVKLSGLLGQAHLETAAARVLLLDLENPVGLIVDEVTNLSRRGGELRAGELYVEGSQAGRVVDLIALLATEFASLARPRVAKVERGFGATSTAPAALPTNEVALVTFEIAGQVYGMALEHVLEVFRPSETIVAAPNSDVADLGVIPFRDRALPLVSLRDLLGFPPGPTCGQRVLVVRIGEAIAGLVVDRLNAIVRVPESTLIPVPAVLNRGAGEARLTALCRLGGERGLISVLNPEKLFSDDATAHILESGCAPEQDMTEIIRSDDRQAFVVFQLGDEDYGLPIASVDEVLKLPDRLTRVPNAPRFIEGVINLRGAVVPIIDQGRRFDTKRLEDARARRIIIISIDGLQAGFIVDKVSEIVSLSPDQLGPAPSLRTEADQIFDRVARLGGDGRMVLIVDPKALLNQAERDILEATVGAGKIAS